MEVVNGKVDAFIYDSPPTIWSPTSSAAKASWSFWITLHQTNRSAGPSRKGDPEFIKCAQRVPRQDQERRHLRKTVPEVVQEYRLAERRAVSRAAETTPRPVALASALLAADPARLGGGSVGGDQARSITNGAGNGCRSISPIGPRSSQGIAGRRPGQCHPDRMAR
jgi:hypothetical protein